MGAGTGPGTAGRTGLSTVEPLCQKHVHLRYRSNRSTEMLLMHEALARARLPRLPRPRSGREPGPARPAREVAAEARRRRGASR